MALTDSAVKAAKLPPPCKTCGGKLPECGECKGKVIKQIKLSDGHGLYLLVNTSGKYWRYDYKMDGRRKTLSIGTYPAVPLAGKKNRAGEFQKGARDLLTDAKQLTKQGVDPSLKKQLNRQEVIAENKAVEALQVADSNTFEVVALRWHNIRKRNWSKKHTETIMGRFNNHVFPFIGNIPVAQLKKTEVSETITRMVLFGSIETAHRVSQIIKQVLEYSCDLGLIDLTPMGNSKNIIPAHKAKPMAAITEPGRLGELLKAIEKYEGTFVVCQALKLLPLLAVRSSEFRKACWTEFDLGNALWTIPAAHRKLTVAQKEDSLNVHLVPLSTQAVSLFKELYKLTGHSGYVFHSVRSKSHIISENTINDAIHAMGFDDMVGHGWRSVFSTILNEKGFNPDAIERQLAHVDSNTVRAAYNRGKYIDKRADMMQKWSNHLDHLRDNT